MARARCAALREAAGFFDTLPEAQEAAVLLWSGRPAAALAPLTRAADVFSSLPDPAYQALAHRRLAQAHALTGAAARSTAAWDASLTAISHIPNLATESEAANSCLLSQSMVALGDGDTQLATSCSTRVLEAVGGDKGGVVGRDSMALLASCVQTAAHRRAGNDAGTPTASATIAAAAAAIDPDTLALTLRATALLSQGEGSLLRATAAANAAASDANGGGAEATVDTAVAELDQALVVCEQMTSDGAVGAGSAHAERTAALLSVMVRVRLADALLQQRAYGQSTAESDTLLANATKHLEAALDIRGDGEGDDDALAPTPLVFSSPLRGCSSVYELLGEPLIAEGLLNTAVSSLERWANGATPAAASGTAATKGDKVTTEAFFDDAATDGGGRALWRLRLGPAASAAELVQALGQQARLLERLEWNGRSRAPEAKVVLERAASLQAEWQAAGASSTWGVVDTAAAATASGAAAGTWLPDLMVAMELDGMDEAGAP